MDRRLVLVLCAGCALLAAPALSAADPGTDLDPSYTGGGSVSSSSTKTGSGSTTSGGGTGSTQGSPGSSGTSSGPAGNALGVKILTRNNAALRRSRRLKVKVIAGTPMAVTLIASVAPVRKAHRARATALTPDGVVFAKAGAKRASLPISRALRRRLARKSARVVVRATGVDTGGVGSRAKAAKTLR